MQSLIIYPLSLSFSVLQNFLAHFSLTWNNVNNKVITLICNSLGFLVSVLNYAAWPFLLPVFQYCHLGQISMSSVLWFHLSFPSANLDLLKYFPDGKYNFLSHMNIQEKKSYMPQWFLHVCLIYWRVNLEALQIWVNADLHLLQHDIGSSFLIILLLPKVWYKEKCFYKHRLCQTSHCTHSQVFVCWFR